MRLFHRTTLLSAIVTGLMTVWPLAIAHAQPDEEEAGTDVEGDEGEEGAEGQEPGEETGGDVEDTSDLSKGDDGSTWGVGGNEEEGKYAPRGKTGKLKELEAEDHEERERVEGPAELPPPGHAYLDTVLGFGSIVVIQQPSGATYMGKSTAVSGDPRPKRDPVPVASFLIGLGYRIGDTWEIFARFPISTAQSDGPIERPEPRRDPDTFKRIATGALELGVRPRFQVTRDLAVPAWISFTFPTAAGDMFAGPDELAKRGEAIVNQAASASRGYRDKALFAYKRFGINPGVGVDWKTELGPGDFQVKADTKVEIMIKTGGNDPAPPVGNESEATLRSTAVNWVLGAGAYYHVLDDMLIPSLDTWISVSTAPEIRGNTDPGGAQWIFEPGVGTHIPFTESKSVGMDAKISGILPAVGELAGSNQPNAKIYGFRIGAGLFF